MEIGEGSGGADPARRLPSPSEFLESLHKLIDDPLTNDVIRWKERNHFVILDPKRFIVEEYATKFLGISNFGLFVRCLYTCGLKKIEKDSFEYRYALKSMILDQFPDDEPLQFPTDNISLLFTKASRISSFFIKLYDMIKDEVTNEIVSWDVPPEGNIFVIWDKDMFCSKVLPRYLGGSVVSFVAFNKHLEDYGFRKNYTHDLPGYEHPDFHKGDRQSAITLAKALKKREGKSGEITELERDIGGRRVEVPAILHQFPVDILLHQNVPLFINRIYHMVGDENTNDIISWNDDGESFFIWDPTLLCETILVRYSIEPNFVFFIRQLHSHGFVKKWGLLHQYSHSKFHRDKPHLLTHINLKRALQERTSQIKRRKLYNKRRVEQFHARARARARAHNRQHQDNDGSDGSLDESCGSN